MTQFSIQIFGEPRKQLQSRNVGIVSKSRKLDQGQKPQATRKLGAKENGLARPGKELTLGAMRQSGVRGVTICCTTCLQTAKLMPDECPDEVELVDLQERFVCPDCGHKGADIEPDFDWDKDLPP